MKDQAAKKLLDLIETIESNRAQIEELRIVNSDAERELKYQLIDAQLTGCLTVNYRAIRRMILKGVI